MNKLITIIALFLLSLMGCSAKPTPTPAPVVVVVDEEETTPVTPVEPTVEVTHLRTEKAPVIGLNSAIQAEVSKISRWKQVKGQIRQRFRTTNANEKFTIDVDGIAGFGASAVRGLVIQASGQKIRDRGVINAVIAMALGKNKLAKSLYLKHLRSRYKDLGLEQRKASCTGTLAKGAIVRVKAATTKTMQVMDAFFADGIGTVVLLSDYPSKGYNVNAYIVVKTMPDGTTSCKVAVGS